MKYLNKFDTKSDYEASASTLEIPNVAYITATTEVIYNATVKTYIVFADPVVEQKCIQLYSTDNIGCTEEDLGAVTSLNALDWSGTSITSFDELQHFTGLTSITDNAFYECSGLTSVTIPDTVTEIRQNAFYNTSLPSVVIPSGVTSIWYSVFANCSGLTSVNIPASATIGQYAFANCSSLSSITFEGTTLPQYLYNDTFTNLPTTGNITVPSGSESNFYSFAQGLGANWTVNNQAPPAPPASNYVLFESSALTAASDVSELTLDGVTISGNSYETSRGVVFTATTGYRFYKECTFDIIATGGNITKIEFTQKDSSYRVTNISAATGTYTVDSGVGTWEASSPLSTVSFSCPSGQARCSKIKVYLE